MNQWGWVGGGTLREETGVAENCWLGHLAFELLVLIGGEGDAAVLRDIHPVYDLCHPLPQLVTLLGAQQPIQNHISILHVLSKREIVSNSNVFVFLNFSRINSLIVESSH